MVINRRSFTKYLIGTGTAVAAASMIDNAVARDNYYKYIELRIFDRDEDARSPIRLDFELKRSVESIINFKWSSRNPSAGDGWTDFGDGPRYVIANCDSGWYTVSSVADGWDVEQIDAYVPGYEGSRAFALNEPFEVNTDWGQCNIDLLLHRT